MNTTLSLLRELLVAHRRKVDAKDVWNATRSSAENWVSLRDAFRAADDACEGVWVNAVAALQAAQAEDTTDEIIEALGAADSAALQKLCGERGLQTLFSAEPTDLESALRKYRKAAAIFTAARELNMRRRQLDVADFEDSLGMALPAVGEQLWQKVVKMLADEEARVEAELSPEQDVDPSEITAEAATRLERRTRLRSEKLADKAIAMLKPHVERRALEAAIEHLEPELRTVARDLSRCIPQLQPQTKPKPQPKPVATLEETDVEFETDTETQTETDWDADTN